MLIVETKIEVFNIPTTGNKITERDIIKQQLRITKDFKKYFPGRDCEIIIIIVGTSYPTLFKYREGRSHIWKLGKEIIMKLQLQAGSQVLIKKYSHFNYELEVIEH